MAKEKKRSVGKTLLKIFVPIIAVLLIAMFVLQAVGFGPLFGLYEPGRKSSYNQKLDEWGIFDNTIEEAMPQTVVHKLVMDHFNAPLPAGKTTKKVIFLGYDGYRADALGNIKDNDVSSIMYIKNQGGLYHTFAGGIEGGDLQATSTAPGWSTMLTGGWAAYHGLDSNGKSKNDAETFLTALARQGHPGSFTVSWRQHTALSYRPDIVKSIEEGLPVAYNHGIDDMATYYTVLSYVAKPAGAEKTPEEDPDVIFFTFEFTDHAGHTYGFGNNKNYKQGSIDADTFGMEIIKTIEARSTYDEEDWLIIISTDHGGTGHNHGGQSVEERSTWLAVNKPIDITDEYLNYAQG